MLLSTHAEVQWNAKNKKHFCDLGYKFTKMRDPFTVKVEDLTDGSSATVIVKCDYCGKEYPIMWQTYMAIKRRSGIKDCCKDCCEIKSKEVIEKKYGGYTEMHASCDDKRKRTNIERYGAANVFGSPAVKEAIKETNLKKYGVPYSQQCAEVHNKTIQTCREKYGVGHYVELFKGKYIKENSPVWKGGAACGRAERATYEYNNWRKQVFCRDKYTCQCCGARNGFGYMIELQAHHIKNWRDNAEQRYDVENGITLCVDCHTEFHSTYGKRNNTEEQLQEFLWMKSDEKVC